MQASYKANLENVKVWEASNQTMILTESEQQTLLQFDVEQFAVAINSLKEAMKDPDFINLSAVLKYWMGGHWLAELCSNTPGSIMLN